MALFVLLYVHGLFNKYTMQAVSSYIDRYISPDDRVIVWSGGCLLAGTGAVSVHSEPNLALVILPGDQDHLADAARADRAIVVAANSAADFSPTVFAALLQQHWSAVIVESWDQYLIGLCR